MNVIDGSLVYPIYIIKILKSCRSVVTSAFLIFTKYTLSVTRISISKVFFRSIIFFLNFITMFCSICNQHFTGITENCNANYFLDFLVRMLSRHSAVSYESLHLYAASPVTQKAGLETTDERKTW